MNKRLKVPPEELESKISKIAGFVFCTSDGGFPGLRSG